jgi:glycosyltransferase involved in cell wall biosynthesis
MTNIWIVNHYASYPGDSATGSRHFSLARRLSQLGWEPVIVAASSEHNSTRQRLPQGASRGTDVRDGVKFRWLRTSSYSGNGIARILNILRFTWALLLPRSTSDLPAPSVIVGSTVHPLAAWAASVLARRRHVPFVFEIRDLWPQTLIDMGKLKDRGIPARLMRVLERKLCRDAAAIITLLPEAHTYLSARGIDARKVHWISNGTDVDEFSVAGPPGGEFQFVYFGSIGRANAVETIVRGFAEHRKVTTASPSKLLIVGEGSEKGQLQALVRREKLDAVVEFRDAVPKFEIPAIAAGAHCLLINVLDLPIYRFGISMNKLFDYMAASRPIIIASSSVNNPVKDANGGISVPADSMSGLSEAMGTIVSATPQERQVWGENNRAFVAANFDYSVLGAYLDHVLSDILKFHMSRHAAGPPTGANA